jgi:hypothetical protein
MKYGKNTALVEEVIGLANGARLLSAVGSPEETNRAWIINDLKLALDISSGEEVGLFRMAPDLDVSDWGNTDLLGTNLINRGEPNLTIDEVREELTWTWHDLTENLVAEFIKTTEYWQRPDRRPLHDALFHEFCGTSLERQLRERFAKLLPPVEPLPGWQTPADQLANNVVCELMWCAENRAFNGLTGNFWEQLFRLYQQGLWPCGWRGVYPQPGKFVAYRRSEANAATGGPAEVARTR